MRFPIKINQTILPIRLRGLLSGKCDPRGLCRDDLNAEHFEECISAIKIGATWKSTRKNRHPLTDNMIMSVVPKFSKPDILDVGVSSGSTSLELLDKLDGRQGQYYISDLYFSLPYYSQGDVTYFYNPMTKKCIMRVSDYTIIYEDSEGALPTLGLLVEHYLANAPKYDAALVSSACMLHPALKQRTKSNPNVIIKEYDIFTQWMNEPVDIIKVANVLNRSYFSEKELIQALVNLKQALKIRGKLFITDNRDEEMVSMFSKTDAGILVLEHEINGGSDIAGIVNSHIS